MNPHRILHEDNDIIVCHKPAGIATQTARVGQADMVSEISNYLAAKKDSAGKFPCVRVVHRLDQPVEGILVFARNKQAAAELSRQAAGEEMRKEYLALVCGRDMLRTGELKDYLLKDGRMNMSRVVQPEVTGAKEARLSYEILRENLPESGMTGYGADGLRCALVRICLHTGRHHQIRVQMANAGMPLLGDHKYAGKEALALSEELGIRETALCAYRLAFIHPKSGRRMQFEIRPEGAAFHKATVKMGEPGV